MAELEGKIALVTGAPEGIGAAVARRFADAGAALVIHYNSREASAQALAAEIRGSGGQVALVQADLLNPASAQVIVDGAVAAFGRIDILVNNAGATARAFLAEVTPKMLADQFRINALSVFEIIQAAVPHFPAEGGRIVNVTTNLCKNPAAGMVAYSAAKAAVENMTLGLAKELARRGITVNAVAPGATLTAMTGSATPEAIAAIGERTPLGRIGRPDDIADAVLFFASPAGRWSTGQSLLVDGGLTDGAFGWSP